MKHCDTQISSRYLLLREMGVVIFFIHFIPVALYHIHVTRDRVAHEYGVMEYFFTLSILVDYGTIV